MMFNMFHGTLAPLDGVARTLSQLSEDGLLPEVFAKRTRSDCPWVAIVITAGCAMIFLSPEIGLWLVAAANFTYLIGIALPSVAVWLLRRDQPDMPRPYRAPRGTVTLGLIAAFVWGTSTILGFSSSACRPCIWSGASRTAAPDYTRGASGWTAERRAERPHSLHVKLTGAMLLSLAWTVSGTTWLSISAFAGHQTPLVAAPRRHLRRGRDADDHRRPGAARHDRASAVRGREAPPSARSTPAPGRFLACQACVRGWPAAYLDRAFARVEFRTSGS